MPHRWRESLSRVSSISTGQDAGEWPSSPLEHLAYRRPDHLAHLPEVPVPLLTPTFLDPQMKTFRRDHMCARLDPPLRQP